VIRDTVRFSRFDHATKQGLGLARPLKAHRGPLVPAPQAFPGKVRSGFPVWNRDHSDWVAKMKTARLEAGPPRLPQLPIRDFSVEGFAGILGFEFLASHELEVFLV